MRRGRERACRAVVIQDDNDLEEGGKEMTTDDKAKQDDEMEGVSRRGVIGGTAKVAALAGRSGIGTLTPFGSGL